MPVKRQITEADGVYFITFTYYQWLPLIEQTDGYDLIYNWFTHLKGKRHYITGYVVMPNHIHALIAFRNTTQSINAIVGNGKRFIAYEIIKRLKQQKDEKLLHRLHLSVETKDKERNKKHEVWEDSFDWKECRTNEYMLQKLNYMHDNPCKGKWNLAGAPVDYEHSSAKYYITGEQGIYEVLNYCELADINLTIPLDKNAEPACRQRQVHSPHTGLGVRHRLRSCKFGKLGREEGFLNWLMSKSDGNSSNQGKYIKVTPGGNVTNTGGVTFSTDSSTAGSIIKEKKSP